MQVQKSARHYTEAAQDEVVLLSQIKKGDPSDERFCVRLLDEFEHSGPHGRHVCMVFEARIWKHTFSYSCLLLVSNGSLVGGSCTMPRKIS